MKRGSCKCCIHVATILQSPSIHHSRVVPLLIYVSDGREFLSIRHLSSRLIEIGPLLGLGSRVRVAQRQGLCKQSRRLGLVMMEVQEGARASGRRGRTISRAPLMIPQRILENHNPPSFASLGNSANSLRGFSSRFRMNSEGDVWFGF